jgi:hypothetical protein
MLYSLMRLHVSFLSDGQSLTDQVSTNDNVRLLYSAWCELPIFFIITAQRGEFPPHRWLHRTSFDGCGVCEIPHGITTKLLRVLVMPDVPNCEARETHSESTGLRKDTLKVLIR